MKNNDDDDDGINELCFFSVCNNNYTLYDEYGICENQTIN